MNKMTGCLALSISLLSLTACNKASEQYFQGYVEGEWLYLSAPQSGYLETLNVSRGDHPARDSNAFTLSGEQNSPQASSQSAALEAQLHAAKAALKLATIQYKRQVELAKQNFVSTSKIDESLTAQIQAAAEVRVLSEQLSNKTVLIPEDGEITELYYHPGEWVPAGQPVASLLPDNNRTIRFFVPETRLASLGIGQAIEMRCDGCSKAISATINFISTKAEYTPPVIYSQGSREKLVFRVEAKPSAQDARSLHPGLPVEVILK